MKYFIFPILLLSVLFSACERDENITPVEPDPVRNPERLDFQSPVVGQFNTFEIRSYECGTEIPSEGGELDLKITGVTEEAIEFTEDTGNGTPFVYSALRKEGMLLYQDCVFYDDGEKFTGDYITSLPFFELDDKTFTDQKVASCVPVVLDLDGYLLYDEHGLSASITVTEGGFGEIITSTTAYLLKAEEE